MIRSEYAANVAMTTAAKPAAWMKAAPIRKQRGAIDRATLQGVLSVALVVLGVVLLALSYAH